MPNASSSPQALSRPFKIVLTGGPGAGKTATLESSRRQFCEHVQLLPESAGIVFGGGFPREKGVAARKAAQRAIYRVQIELERYAETIPGVRVVICDRGTVDGLAYWPGPPADMWDELGTTHEAELARYDAVIHLRTPSASNGYHRDPIRVESAHLAQAIDERLLEAWALHKDRSVVETSLDFVEKAKVAIERISAFLPQDCRQNCLSRR